MPVDLLLQTILAERRRQAEAVARERLATRARGLERARSGDGVGRWLAIEVWLGTVLAGLVGTTDRSGRHPDATPDCCDGSVG
jgi:hypothetical protein